MFRTFSITTIVVTAAIGGSIVDTGGMIVRVTAHTIAMIAVTGDRRLLIATVRHRSIAAATRMCGGATTVIVPTEPTIIRSSPIMGHGASATRHISKTKKPRKTGAFFLIIRFKNQVT